MHLNTRQLKILQEMGLSHPYLALPAKGKSRAQKKSTDSLDSVPNTFAAPSLSAEIVSSVFIRPVLATPSQKSEHALSPPPKATNYDTVEVSTLSWEELKDKALTCVSCELSKTRKQVCFGSRIDSSNNKSIPPAAINCSDKLDWLIVDFIPTDLEDQTQNPLLAESGQLLGNMLRALRSLGKSKTTKNGTQRENSLTISLINAVKCHAPGGRVASNLEIHQCRPYLIRQIELLKPKTILILGSHAFKAVFPLEQKEGLTDGAVAIPFARIRSETRFIGTIPTFITYHPSYLLTHPEDKSKAWHDLFKAYQHTESLSS